MTPTREEFLFISDFGRHLFYTITYVSLLIAGWQLLGNARIWMKGRPVAPLRPKWLAFVPSAADFSRYCRNVWIFIIGQKKVQGSRPRSGAPLHLMIFYGFLTLFIGTTLLAINTYGPIKFHKGLYYLVYEMTLDIMGAVFLVGLAWAAGRRFVENHRSGRTAWSHQFTDYWALALLFIVGLTGFWLEAARMSVNPKPFDWSGPVGHLWSELQGPMQPETYRLIWWFHMVWIWIFFATFPQMKLRHIFLAVLSAGGKPEKPMGHLEPISIEQVEETGQIGATSPFDFNRWQLLSLDACMECGRCTEVCPAWGVGKELNPKQIVQGIRKAASSNEPILAEVTEEALWACTTCNACVEACPVLIRHVDLIVDTRRNLVSEGKLVGPAAAVLRQTASTSHAWGAAKESREDWMRDLDIPLCRNTPDFEFLFWVGCAGATDPGAIRTTVATAKLLKIAGVKFACLGNEEACTGDPARRLGEEFLFQEKATMNVEAFKKYKVQKVITACPHCLNTLKNEYGEFGAQLQVFHHTEILDQLIQKGSLNPADILGEKVTYHDPCYLARVNGKVDSPRRSLGSESNEDADKAALIAWLEQPPIQKSALLEPNHHGRKTLCCGAGGGRMWMEESKDQRPSNRRAQELVETGADTVAVACPFCRIMLESGLSQVTERPIQLTDIAELVLKANEKS